MRNGIAFVVFIVAAALVYCAVISNRSDRDIAPRVTNFLISLLPPVIGNLIIIVAHTEGYSLFGRYLYAVGIDITMYCLLDFTLQYCGLKWNKVWHRIVIACIALDIIQLLCNPFFGHAFAPYKETAYGAPYYNVVSHTGRNIHLALVYAIMTAVLVILFVKMIKSSRIHSEKYSIMFMLLLGTGLWEFFYIFSRTPVKRSVIAYGVFGILVFYFSLYYRPRRTLDRLLADTASGLTDGLFFFDENGKCMWADEHGCRLTGLGDSDFTHFSGRLSELFPEIELDKNDWKCRLEHKGRYYDLEKHSVYDSSNRDIGSVLSVQDETEDELSLQRERYISNHDPLTGMYTKKHLLELTRERIDADPDKTFYVAYMDIKHFKLVNDVFGRDFGDEALRQVAASISRNLPPGAIYGRLGGDAFGFCFAEDEFNIDLAEKYMSEFVVERDDITHTVVIHQGVYKVTERAMDVSVMFDRAHMAQQLLKNDYTRHVAFYDDALRDRALLNQEIARRIPDALAGGQIVPYFQAIVSRDREIIGAEALVRWIHPEKGMISPAEFIPVIEGNGMIAEVDRHMWRCACGILRRWAEEGRDDLFISVNVSPKDFYFMDVYEEFSSIAKQYGIDPSKLRIEITETMVMDDSESRLGILSKLRDAGFVVEMDDFGSGYSSLNMLKSMPVDVIKIDMNFINDLQDSSRSSTILRNLMNMMSELGLVPLTEGVETEEQYEILSRMSCELFQGYLFAKPVPIEDFEKNI